MPVKSVVHLQAAAQPRLVPTCFAPKTKFVQFEWLSKPKRRLLNKSSGRKKFFDKIMENLRVILIGGSSHSGKSVVAKTIAYKINWSFLSTDSLARHPGRPWRTNPNDIPSHVVEHYSTLSVEQLFEDVLTHYSKVWIKIEGIISLYVNASSYSGLILEGSAIWPEFVAEHRIPDTKSIWLTAADDLFQKRIYRESNYEQVSDSEKYLIDKFLKRTQHFNEKMMAAISRLNLKSIEVNDTLSPEDVSNMCLQRICENRV